MGIFNRPTPFKKIFIWHAILITIGLALMVTGSTVANDCVSYSPLCVPAIAFIGWLIIGAVIFSFFISLLFYAARSQTALEIPNGQTSRSSNVKRWFNISGIILSFLLIFQLFRFAFLILWPLAILEEYLGKFIGQIAAAIALILAPRYKKENGNLYWLIFSVASAIVFIGFWVSMISNSGWGNRF